MLKESNFNAMMLNILLQQTMSENINFTDVTKWTSYIKK
jgi:hypothetical protein